MNCFDGDLADLRVDELFQALLRDRTYVPALRAAQGAGMDLDHAVEAVRQRTMSRYLSLRPEADPEVAEKFEPLSGAAANVSGIRHWLYKLEQPTA